MYELIKGEIWKISRGIDMRKSRRKGSLIERKEECSVNTKKKFGVGGVL